MPTDFAPHNMTSDTAPAPYVASASSEFSSTFAAYKAFDGAVGASQYWIGTGSGVDYLQLDLGQTPPFSPTNMTSDTAPSPFVASESSAVDVNHGAWGAFTSNINNHWGASASTGWMQIDLGAGNSQLLGVYRVVSSNDSTPTRQPNAWTMQGSNDGSTFTVIDTQTGQTSWGNFEQRSFTCATQSTAYRYFRLNVTANNGDTTHLSVGALLLVAQGVTSAQLLGSYAIQANTVPEPLRSPKNWTMQGSNNGSAFTTLNTQTNQTSWGSGETRTFAISSPGTTAYRYFRLSITANNGDATYTDVGEMYLYVAVSTFKRRLVLTAT